MVHARSSTSTRGREGERAFSSDLNILISSSVAAWFCRYATITRQDGEQRFITFTGVSRLTSVADTEIRPLFPSNDAAERRHPRAKMLFPRINSLAPIIDICSRAVSNAELIRFARNRRIRCILITMLTDEREREA